MILFRVRIELKAPLGTPLTSGTLFGHLCWARREISGEAALTAWLGGLRERPWALSDGFPSNRLPFPMLPAAPVELRPDKMDKQALDRRRQAKERSKRAWISLDAWKAHRDRMTATALREEVKGDERGGGEVRLAHNAIDRRAGATLEKDGLYFVDEDWSFAGGPDAALYDVYVRAGTSEAELAVLFSAVGEAGYGRDATWGRGHFAVSQIDRAAVAWLDQSQSNRMLSLSQGALTLNMLDPRYQLYTLYGKLGAGMSADRPWKKPLLLTRAGGTFRPANAGPFGGWLTNVHQDRPDVGHNAYHVAIPYSEAES